MSACDIGVFRVCNCWTSLSIPSSTLFMYALSPSLIFSCVTMMCACAFRSDIEFLLVCASVNYTLFCDLGHKLYRSFVLSVTSDTSLSSVECHIFIWDFFSSSSNFFLSPFVVCIIVWFRSYIVFFIFSVFL